MRCEFWTDISLNQNGDPLNPKLVDFMLMKSRGVDGVCVRKSMGYRQDASFIRNWTGARAAGLKTTAYVVPFVGYDLVKQLDAAMLGLNPAELDRPPWVDLERAHNFGLAIGTKLAADFLNGWAAALGQKPQVYTSKYLWETWYSKARGWGDDWGLVVANYGASIPAIPAGWRYRKDDTPVPTMLAWQGWQYSADGNGLGAYFGAHSGSIDLSWQKTL